MDKIENETLTHINKMVHSNLIKKKINRNSFII